MMIAMTTPMIQLTAVEAGIEGDDGGVDGIGDVVHLNGVADAESRQRAEDAEENGEPVPILAQAVLDIVHRAADPVAVLVALTEPDGEDDFGEFGAHADESGDPQPEDRAGAAERNGRDDAGDVAGADGRRQGGGDCLEGSDFALTGRMALEDPAQRVAHRIAEPAELDESGHDAEDQPCADQEDEHGDAPHDAVDGVIDFSQPFHSFSLSFSVCTFAAAASGGGDRRRRSESFRNTKRAPPVPEKLEQKQTDLPVQQTCPVLLPERFASQRKALHLRPSHLV